MYRQIPVMLLMLALALGAPVAAADGLWEVYQLALDNDPQLRAAAARLQGSREAQEQVQARYRPDLSLDANLTAQRQDVDISGTDNFLTHGYSLNLRQALYDRDALIERDQASAQTEQAEASFLSAKQALALRVAERYFEVLAAIDNLEFAAAEKNAIARQLEQTQQRFEVGLTAITDVHEAQARYDLATAQEIAASNALDNARESLREVTNRYHEGLRRLNPDAPLVVPEPDNIESWADTAVTQNLEVIALQRGVDASREAVERQRSQRTPSVDLVGRHSFTDQSDSNFFAAKTTNTSIGVQLTWPFYQGGRTGAATRQAQQALNEVLENLEQQRRAAVRQTRSAYLGVQAGISRVKALKQALVSSQSALEATEAGLEVGTRTTVDVLDAQRELYRARRDLARARYDYILDTLRLKQAAGILSADDLQQIGNWLN